MVELFKTGKRISVGFDSYAYARVSAMKGNLLPKSDYDKLLKMSLNDLIKYLQEKQYKKEIDELATKFEGIELMESALTLNLERTLAKLRRISNEGLNQLISEYLKRWDIYNIKTIIRGKYSNASNEEIKKAIVAGGSYTKEFLNQLISLGSLKNVFEKLKNPQLSSLYIKVEKGDASLFAIENLLDFNYYNEMLDVARKVSSQGNIFGEFLKKEITILNLKTIVKLKDYGMNPAEIKKYLIFSNKQSEIDYFEKILKLEKTEDILKELSKHYPIIKKVYTKDKSIIDLEIELNRALYEGAVLLLHKYPLSINTILGYMFTKETEINNLKILIKAKQLNVKEEIVSQGLVIGGK